MIAGPAVLLAPVAQDRRAGCSGAREQGLVEHPTRDAEPTKGQRGRADPLSHAQPDGLDADGAERWKIQTERGEGGRAFARQELTADFVTRARGPLAQRHRPTRPGELDSEGRTGEPAAYDQRFGHDRDLSRHVTPKLEAAGTPVMNRLICALAIADQCLDFARWR